MRSKGTKREAGHLRALSDQRHDGVDRIQLVWIEAVLSEINSEVLLQKHHQFDDVDRLQAAARNQRLAVGKIA